MALTGQLKKCDKQKGIEARGKLYILVPPIALPLSLYFKQKSGNAHWLGGGILSRRCFDVNVLQ